MHVLRRLNKVLDEENDQIEGIAFFASDGAIDVAPTAFNFDDPDDVNGADQNVLRIFFRSF